MKKLLLLLLVLCTTSKLFAQTFSSGGLNYNVTSLTTVEVGLNPTASGDFVIPTTVTNGANAISYAVTSIGNDAFSGCSSLTSVIIQDSVVGIGDYAFYNCTSLVNVSIPNSVKKIGNYTFTTCTGLTFVTIPHSVTTIGVSAFQDCTSLTSVLLYDGLREITALAFAGCTALPNLTIPGSVKSIGVAAFENCTSLNNITIPESVSKIGSSAFVRCTAITDIIIPSSVTIIDVETFRECTSLKNIIIPESIIKIERKAFDQCTSLLSINIPSSVTSIIESAFRLCTGLKNITVNWETPLGVNLNIFSNTAIKDVALIVPNGKKNIYKETAVWKDFNPIVEPLIAPFTGQTFEAGGINYIVTKATSPFEVAVGNNRDFVGAAVIPENVNNYWNSFKVTSVSVEAFLKNSSNNGSLTSISLPTSLKSISSSAFYDCNLLTTLIFPPIIESIGQDALHGCSSLTSLNLPSSLTSIADRAFFGCIGLQSVTVNWNIPLTINANVFGDVSLNNLKLNIPIRTKDAYQAASVWRNFGAFSVPNAIRPTNETLFTVNGINYIVTKDEAPYEAAIANNQEYSGDAEIPDVVNFEDNDFIVTSISVAAFGASFDTGAKLTSIRLPNSITTIDDKAFFHAYNLKSINLPSKLAYIGRDAFSNCVSLTSINIPTTVDYIGDLVFDTCINLRSMTVNWIIPYDLISGYVFDGLNLADVDLIVPSGTLTVYKNTPVWENFKTITEIDSAPVIGQKIIEEGVTYIITKNTLPYEVAVGNSTTSSAKVSASSKNQQSTNISGALIIPSTIVSEDKTFIVTSIIPNGFSNNIGITSVTIPKTIISIGNDAFANCTGITFVNVDWTIPLSITPNVFGGVALGNIVLNIPSGTKSAYQAAQVWQSFNPIVEPVVLPIIGQTFTANGINYIVTKDTTPYEVAVGNNTTFSGIANIPATVNYSGNNLAVTSISNEAFENCENLAEISLPNSINSIGESAFSRCFPLNKVVIPNRVTQILDSTFQRSGLTEITIPNSVTIIERYAFQNCRSLTSVNIPNSVITIGNNAFEECITLTSISIPNSVTSIGDDAFYYCIALPAITIPNSVTTIGENVFTGCEKLTSVTVNWATPLPINSNVFRDLTLSNVVLNVPAGTTALYEAAAVWTDFNIVAPTPATHLNFDGVDDYVVLPLNNTIIPTSNFTHEFWFKTTDLNGTMFTASTGTLGNPSGWDRTIYMENGKVSAYNYTGESNTTLTTTASYNDGNWHHVAHVVNAAGSILYLDGIVAASNAVAASVFTTNTEVTLGVSPLAGGSYFSGNIDDVRIWNVARSASDIARAKNCELAGNENGLLAYYKFNQGTDQGTNTAVTSLLDATNNAYHGTLNSGFALAGTASNFLAGSVVTTGNTIPVAPTASVQSFCTAATASNLVPAMSATIKWYATATSTTALVSSDVLATGTYYAAAVNANGCESARTAIAITVNTTAAPTVAGGANTSIIINATESCSALLSGTYIDSELFFGKKVFNKSDNTSIQIAFDGQKWVLFIDSNLSSFIFSNTTVPSGLYPPNTGWIKNNDLCSGTMTIDLPTATATFCSGATVANLTATGTDLKWYSTETGGTALTTTTALATGTYYVSQTLNGCESARTALAVTIDTVAAPTAAAQSFCSAATASNLVPAISATVKWHATATSTTALVASDVLATGTYYAAAVNANGCESARTAVAVTINTTPAPTFVQSGIASSDINVIINSPSCAAVSGRYYQDGMIYGKNYYVSNSNNQLRLSFDGSRWRLTYFGSIIEYENATVPSGLFPPKTGWIINSGSAYRCTGTMTIDLPTATKTFCSGATVANLTATGTDLKWYSTETGGTALATTTALATGTYYVSQTLNGCESARTPLAVTIDAVAAPTAAAQTFTTAATVANLVPAASSTIKWYDAATGGTALPTTTAIATGNYYVTETNANGCESARTTVAVTVNLEVLPAVGDTFAANGINYIVTKATLPYEVAVGNNRSFVGAAVIPNTATNNGYSFAVKSIANFAFDRCATVTSVTIPDSVIRIGDTAFYLCHNLTSVTIPNSVTSIGESTFLGCTSLSSVTIANSVTSIGELAFGGCTSLTSFNVNWSTPLSINPNVFDGVILANVGLNVPTGTRAAYQAAAVWKNFNPIVEPVITPATHLNFDGVDDYVVLPLNNTIIPTSNFTHEFWFKTTDLNGTMFTASTGTLGNPSGWDRTIYMDNGKVSAYNYTGESNTTLTTTATYNDGNWHHVAHVVNATGSKLYLDGNLEGSNAVSSSTFTWNTEVTLGVSPFGSYFSGNIDDVRIWNFARSASEITRAKNCELAGNETGLLAYYKFNQGTDQGTNTAVTSILDATTNGNHGTLNSGFAKTGTTSNFLAGSVVTTGSTLPAAPTASLQSFCTAATASNLVPAMSATIKWYATATSTTALVASDVLATGTYYTAAVNANGCESERTALAVTVNTTPAPTVAASTSIDVKATGSCSNISGTYTEGAILNGKKTFVGALEYVVYDGSKWVIRFEYGTFITERFTNTNVSNGLLPPTSGWIATSNCPGGTMTIDFPLATKTLCPGATVANLTATGTDLKWYSTETGGTALTTTTALATGTYYVSQTLNGCESARTALAVTIDTIAAPTASAQTFTTASTVVNLVPAPSTAIKWYDVATGGTALATTTAIATGNYYVSETNANGCESARTSVAVTVNLVVLPFIGQTFTFEGINYIVTKDTRPYEVAVGDNFSFVGAAIIPVTVTNDGFAFGVTSIGVDAFRSCAQLTSVTIPNSVSSIGNYAFYSSRQLTVVSIPNSVTSIGEFAFAFCTRLGTINIPNALTSLGQYAFNSCAITSIMIPSTLTRISEGAFANCNLLQSINIPVTVVNISTLAFGNCEGLTTFTVNWNTPLTIDPDVFKGLTLANITLNVPTGLEALYGSTNVWREFKSTTLGTNGYDNSSNLKFYPNPAQSQINFSQEIINLEVFDITGKKVKWFQKSSATFDVSNLEKGVYILQGKTTEEKILIQKMIKE